jgi:hypothetical protein
MIGAPFIQLAVKKSTTLIGKFDSMIQSKIDKLKIAALERDLNKSKKECQDVSKMIPLLKLPVATINQILEQIKTLIKTIKGILTLLKQLLKATNAIPSVPITPPLPVPAVPMVIPPLPSIYPTIGNLMKIVDIKSFATKQIELLESILNGLNSFIDTISNLLKKILDKLSMLSSQVNSCQNKHNIDSTSTNKDLSEVMDGVENAIPKNLVNDNNSYKGFTFKIVEDANKFTSKNVNRRYAIALNSSGIETLKGTPSFATSAQILINELKFIIDTQGLIG